LEGNSVYVVFSWSRRASGEERKRRKEKKVLGIVYR